MSDLKDYALAQDMKIRSLKAENAKLKEFIRDNSILNGGVYDAIAKERDRYKTFWDWARETDKMLFESDMKAKQALQEGEK